MAKYIPHLDRFTLEEQLKVLGDEELLDFWEESQFLSGVLEEQNQTFLDNPMEYEQLILKELQLRTSMRSLR